MGILKGYLKFNNALNKVVGYIMMVLLAIMTVLIFWQVFARFVTNNPSTFSEEASRFMMIWLALLGSAFALRKRELVAVDVIYNALKGKKKRIITMIISVISIFFYLIMIIYGYKMANSISFQTAPTTGISMFWPMLAIPAGGLLLLLNAIAVSIEEFVNEEVD